MLDNPRWTTTIYPSRCLACHQPIAAGETVYAPGPERCNVYCAPCGRAVEPVVTRKRALIAAGVDLRYPVYGKTAAA